jgi:THUMP domain-like/Conserved hypothetical protein 95
MHDQYALTDFINRHIDADPTRLLLAKHKEPVDIQSAALQIAALQKIKTKVPSWYRPDLRFPALVACEQCSSQATSFAKTHHVLDKRVLDLSGGLGIDSWAFSHAAKEVVYVEPQPHFVRCARYNFDKLGIGAERIQCIQSTAEGYLERYSGKFDVIFIDPDRRNATGARVIGFADCSPDVLALLPQLLERTELLLIKASPMLDIALACKQLGYVHEVEVIGWQDECKELLFHLRPTKPEQTMVYAVELNEDGAEAHRIEKVLGQTSVVEYSMPQAFLYDPPATVLKADCLVELANTFGLRKLHANTHLFTSELLVPNVPGRTFALESMTAPRADGVKEYLPEAKANLRCVNFPDNTATLKKRLKIKDGGDAYLFAARLLDESLKMLICKKIK